MSKDFLEYYIRAMRRVFMSKVFLLCSLKISDVRYIYKFLVGDCSLVENEIEKVVDLRV